MQNYRRFFPLIGSGILIASLALGGRMFPAVWFVYNYTDSLPKGFYRIEKKPFYHRGDLLVFKVPEEVRQMVKDRHWLRDNGFLVKPLIPFLKQKCYNIPKKEVGIWHDQQVVRTFWKRQRRHWQMLGQ